MPDRHGRRWRLWRHGFRDAAEELRLAIEVASGYVVGMSESPMGQPEQLGAFKALVSQLSERFEAVTADFNRKFDTVFEKLDRVGRPNYAVFAAIFGTLVMGLMSLVSVGLAAMIWHTNTVMEPANVRISMLDETVARLREDAKDDRKAATAELLAATRTFGSFDARIAESKAGITAVEDRRRDDLTALQAQLARMFGDLKAEIRTEFANIDTRLQNEIGWRIEASKSSGNGTKYTVPPSKPGP